MKDKVKALFGLLKGNPIANRDELAEVCKQTALEQLRRDTLQLQKDAEVQALNDRYDGQIDAHQRAIDENVKRIENWCKANRDAEFGAKQSLFIQGHELSFHRSAEAVGFAEGLKADDLVEAILGLSDDNEAHAFLKDALLRVKADLDKNAIKREMKVNPAARGLLEDLGVRLVKKETFQFAPSRESIAVVETSAA